ncbi:syndecan-3-like, partial [Littorina saxatilis]|uniref:syndecan-3-like n=1 Tax=Littorina saxatilis TaxID=31220 RepID=UPI0038B60215
RHCCVGLLQDQPGWSEYEEISGSGSGMDATDDEDLLTSGSGSGASSPDFTDTTRYTPKPTTTSTTTTASPLSPCENLRDASKHLLGNYVPRCTEQGDYDSLQCRGHPGTGTCWCADLSGREIPGTALNPPNTPDCDTGTNLPPCVFRLVQQSRSGLLGAFRPKCTLKGDFKKEQCSGSMCYCADSKSGVKISNTEVFLPDRPNCSGDKPIEEPRKTDKPITSPPRETTLRPMEEEIVTKINVNIGIGVEGEDKKDEKPPVSNETGGSGPMKEPSSAAHVMTQPGILAAIIGGSVVLLLCAILLVMFIVYRMRKKDEGSYALDEPKKMPNYSYQRAPDKEFYA